MKPAKPNPIAFIPVATQSFTKKTLGLETTEPAPTPHTVPTAANTGTNFVKKPKLGGAKSKKRDIPEGLWTKCPKCSTMVFDKELDENLKVCAQLPASFPHRRPRAHPFPRRNLHVRGDGRRR